MEAYEVLKSLREKKGMTQEELAEKVLVTMICAVRVIYRCAP